MNYQNIQEYIISEEASYKTTRIPLTDNKDWNMYQHIQRCKNVANAWYNTGADDGNRPYDDLVTPIINVAFRTEGFDVKDIVPYVNDEVNYHKSFLVKKYHPKWARKHELDTLIDQAVEGSIIYDLVVFKNIDNVPEIVPLESIAFCDQTNVLSGPICIKHQYSVQDLLAFKGKWNSEKIDEAIVMARQSKGVANGKDAKTPGRYIEVYELRGDLPEDWLDENGSSDKYVPQLQIVCFHTKDDGTKDKIILYKGKSKPLTEVFDALKIDQVRSHGRACGRSIVETLFEEQVWTNYSAIKIKEYLDSAINVFISDSDDLGNQNISQLNKNTILKQEKGASTQRLSSSLENLPSFTAHQETMKQNARIKGSASEAQLGVNPTSGTPFKLQDLVVQQGQGIHEYRQGKIATFFADRLYKNWILKSLVADMNKGDKWLDDLTLEELQYVAEAVGTKEANRKAVKLVLKKKPKDEISQEEIIAYRDMVKDQWMKGGNKRFLEIMKDELNNLDVDVFVNIAGKQAYLAQQADKMSNMVRFVLANLEKIQQSPGVAKWINETAEASGLNPINFDFSKITPNTINQPKPETAMAQK